MKALLFAGLSDDEKERLKEVEEKRQRDQREQRIADQVARIEQEVRALRALLRGGKDADDARH